MEKDTLSKGTKKRKARKKTIHFHENVRVKIGHEKMKLSEYFDIMQKSIADVADAIDIVNKGRSLNNDTWWGTEKKLKLCSKIHENLLKNTKTIYNKNPEQASTLILHPLLRSIFNYVVVKTQYSVSADSHLAGVKEKEAYELALDKIKEARDGLNEIASELKIELEK